MKKLILLSILFFIGCVTEPEVEGCIDNSACNYDLNATKDDGSCTYAEINYDCEGNCFDGYTELNWYDGACYYDEDISTAGQFQSLYGSLYENFFANGLGLTWHEGKVIAVFIGVQPVNQNNILDIIFKFKSLLEIDIMFKNIGSIPSTIGELTNLTKFSTYNCSMEGTIPSEFWNLVNLTELTFFNDDLTEGGLSGSIPEEIGNLTNLDYLTITGQELTGAIPNNISNLSKLKYFDIWDNKFTSLPESFCNLPEDCEIYVSGNCLSEEYHYDCIDDWDTDGNYLQTNCP